MAAISVKYHFDTEDGDYAEFINRSTMLTDSVIFSVQNGVIAIRKLDKFIAKCSYVSNIPYYEFRYYLNGKRSTYQKVAEHLRKTADNNFTKISFQ